MRTVSILPISDAAFEDILTRIRELGVEYVKDMVWTHRVHGLMIVLDGSQVALCSETTFDSEARESLSTARLRRE